MLQSTTPAFGEALPEFLEFIKRYGFSTELVWVFREDFTYDRRCFWIRLPVRGDNALLAEQYYEHGRARGLGVTLDVLCRIDAASACYVSVPQDEMDASQRMQGPLNFKIPQDPICARRMCRGPSWQIRRAINRVRGYNDISRELPSRAKAKRLISEEALRRSP